MSHLPRLHFSPYKGLGKGGLEGGGKGTYEKALSPLPPNYYSFSPNLLFAIAAAILIAALRESGDALPVPARL
jgi:hypothetical protein